ncbi:MAG: hypothetical protein KIS87_11000 [Phycisphaeraceae bacterium]|nr:hypothetical protein [Phycisphaeraceae bacterium]
MPRTVVLEHTLPDGSRHFDWLMEPAEPGPDATDEDRSLLAFRLAVRIDDTSIRSFLAESMPDHRRLYLHHEGALSGDRGIVVRVADGACRVVRRSQAGIEVEVAFTGMRRVLHGRPLHGGVWAFEQAPE